MLLLLETESAVWISHQAWAHGFGQVQCTSLQGNSRQSTALCQDRGQPWCSRGSRVRGCLYNSTTQRLKERFWFCPKGKHKHTRKTLNFLHKPAFQPPCFMCSYPRRWQTHSYSQSGSSVQKLMALDHSSKHLHSSSFPLFHQQLLHRLCSSHIPWFYLLTPL